MTRRRPIEARKPPMVVRMVSSLYDTVREEVVCTSLDRPAYFLSRRFLMRKTTRASFRCVSSCCQILRTCHPLRRSVAFTARSRFRLRASFTSQKRRFDTGLDACLGHMCQKQPSTKIAIRSRGNTKSGFPNIRLRRRQPVSPCLRRTLSSASSVRLFSRLLIRDMMEERFATGKTSAISVELVLYSIRDLPFRARTTWTACLLTNSGGSALPIICAAANFPAVNEK